MSSVKMSDMMNHLYLFAQNLSFETSAPISFQSLVINTKKTEKR